VEQKVSLRLPVLLFAVSGILLPQAKGHGLNFLLVKATPAAGQLRLDISADFSNNPLIENAAQAQEIITSLLQVQTPAGSQAVGQAAGFSFQPSSEVDPTCPFQPPVDPVAPPHQLVTGTTYEPITSASATLSIPKGNPHDVLFWTSPPTGPAQKLMMIAGDSTGPIPIPQAPQSQRPFPIWLWGAITLGYVALRWRMIRRKVR
jgi:hypothetical protein